MRVLFVSSGNASSKSGISPIIENQGKSLIKEGIEVDFFPIKGKGAKGYLKAIFKLREHIKTNHYDITHAHYWISAIVATFAGAKPTVASLMGDDVKTKEWYKWIIYIFYKFFWAKTVVKSKDMYNAFGQKGVAIIPNGVDMQRFKPIDREEALNFTKWDRDKKHILFTSDPAREEKNFTLAKEAVDLLNDKNIELHYLKDIPNSNIPYYYNSADVVVLTSTREGSPNAIKEAMACNIPIVSTDVGDVKDVISKTKGCYIASFEPKDFSNKIKLALEFNQRTTGRKDIEYLNETNIAKKIIKIYKEVK